jgi:hypothetical protein
MKRAVHVCAIGLAALLSAATAMAQNSITNIITNQGGGFKSCDTQYLAAGVFSRVMYDDAGQPCVYRGSQIGKNGEHCDPDTAWNYSVHGHFTLKTAPGYESGQVEVRMYIGGGGGECTGGQTTSCPDFEVPGHHYLVEDSTYNISGADTNTSVPFDALEIQLPAFSKKPGDGNYQGFWIFAKPIGAPVLCTNQAFTSEEHN